MSPLTNIHIANNDGHMDVDGEPPRGRSNVLSAIFSREASTHSVVSSISYVNRMEIQNNNPLWADQVEESK